MSTSQGQQASKGWEIDNRGGRGVGAPSFRRLRADIDAESGGILVEWDAPEARHVVIQGRTFDACGRATFRVAAGEMLDLTAVGATGQAGETRHVYMVRRCDQEWPMIMAAQAALATQRAPWPGTPAEPPVLPQSPSGGAQVPGLREPHMPGRRHPLPRLLMARSYPAWPRIGFLPLASGRNTPSRGTQRSRAQPRTTEENSWDAC